jgi:hypothetical protein
MELIHGNIYKIEPIVEHDPNEIYIGSTINTLKHRFNTHKASYKLWLKKNQNVNRTRSFDLFQKYGYNNLQIILLETIECETKDEMRLREAHYIRTINNINHNVPKRNKKEYYLNKKNKYKEYYLKNRDKLIAYQKLYEEKKRLESMMIKYYLVKRLPLIIF